MIQYKMRWLEEPALPLLGVLAVCSLFFLLWVRRLIRRKRQEARWAELGRAGEEELAEEIRRFGGFQLILANLYLPGRRAGTTTEIDLLVLRKNGIFVIENKNYSGWIFGDKNSPHWMQIRPRGERRSFYNPIWQNEGHVNALLRFLGWEDTKFEKKVYSIVVFSPRCTLKKMKVRGAGAKVIQPKKLRRSFFWAGVWHPGRFSRRELHRIYQQLQPCCRVTRSVQRRHKNDVRKKAKSRGFY